MKIINPAQSVGALVNYVLGEISELICVADVAGSLNSKYFRFNSDNVGYYVWFNVATLGVDPSGANAGRTGIEVALSSGATANAVASAVALAVTAAATGEAVATASLATVTIKNVTSGNAVNASAGNSGFSAATPNEGVSGTLDEITPGTLVSSLNNNP